MTAVEFLVQQILKHDKSFVEFYNAEIEQASELFEKQIIEAYKDGRSDQQSKDGRFYNRNSEYYYNKTYKK
jgi:hypothetical protein